MTSEQVTFESRVLDELSSMSSEKAERTSKKLINQLKSSEDKAGFVIRFYKTGYQQLFVDAGNNGDYDKARENFVVIANAFLEYDTSKISSNGSTGEAQARFEYGINSFINAIDTSLTEGGKTECTENLIHIHWTGLKHCLIYIYEKDVQALSERGREGARTRATDNKRLAKTALEALGYDVDGSISEKRWASLKAKVDGNRDVTLEEAEAAQLLPGIWVLPSTDREEFLKMYLRIAIAWRELIDVVYHFYSSLDVEGSYLFDELLTTAGMNFDDDRIEAQSELDSKLGNLNDDIHFLLVSSLKNALQYMVEQEIYLEFGGDENVVGAMENLMIAYHDSKIPSVDARYDEVEEWLPSFEDFSFRIGGCFSRTSSHWLPFVFKAIMQITRENYSAQNESDRKRKKYNRFVETILPGSSLERVVDRQRESVVFIVRIGSGDLRAVKVYSSGSKNRELELYNDCLDGEHVDYKDHFKMVEVFEVERGYEYTEGIEVLGSDIDRVDYVVMEHLPILERTEETLGYVDLKGLADRLYTMEVEDRINTALECLKGIIGFYIKVYGILQFGVPDIKYDSFYFWVDDEGRVDPSRMKFLDWGKQEEGVNFKFDITNLRNKLPYLLGKSDEERGAFNRLLNLDPGQREESKDDDLDIFDKLPSDIIIFIYRVCRTSNPNAVMGMGYSYEPTVFDESRSTEISQQEPFENWGDVLKEINEILKDPSAMT